MLAVDCMDFLQRDKEQQAVDAGADRSFRDAEVRGFQEDPDQTQQETSTKRVDGE